MPVRFLGVAKVIGILTILFSATFLVPLAMSIWFSDGESYHLAGSAGLVLLLGLVLWFPARNETEGLRNADAFLIVAVFWIGLGLLGALPFVLGPHLGFVDSVFEAVSGFTTTGATVITGLDSLPPSILFYRQQLQWLGGAGVVLLAVAILPVMGVGGMQLYRAEIPGPEKDAKLTPRIAKTARYLWGVYVALTAACALAYWLAGMELFDAVAHSLTTISTGGFSTHDASLAFFQSGSVEVVAQVFMVLGAINFAVHFRAWDRRNPAILIRDPEVRTFIWVIVVAVAVICLILVGRTYFPDLLESLRYSSFHMISIITTTGYTTTDFSAWPAGVPVMLMFLSFFGGCAGSTAGGIKIVRVMLLWKQGIRELRMLIHPKLIAAVRLGQRVQDDKIISAVWSFFALYAVTFAFLMVLLMMTGVDQVTAFSAIATCMNNLGPGLGDIAANFTAIGDTGKLIAVCAMLLGRLEILTILVLLTPDFWRS